MKKIKKGILIFSLMCAGLMSGCVKSSDDSCGTTFITAYRAADDVHEEAVSYKKNKLDLLFADDTRKYAVNLNQKEWMHIVSDSADGVKPIDYTDEEIDNYAVGDAMTLYNPESIADVTFYPDISNNKVLGVQCIARTKYGLSACSASELAEQLNSIKYCENDTWLIAVEGSLENKIITLNIEEYKKKVDEIAEYVKKCQKAELPG